ncbi:MAG: tetratricopeptide repeat protein, partial [Flavobacterium sp.]
NISKAYNNIGIVYKSQQNSKKALEYFKKAYNIQEEIGEQAAAVSMMNIGVIYFEAGDNAEAFNWYQKAAKRFETSDNTRGFALLKNYLGDYYKKQNDFAQARKYYEQSAELYESMQNKFGAALALYNIGQLLFDSKQYNDAIGFGEKSLEYAKSIGVLDQEFHSEKLLSDIYAALNRPSESLMHYKNYVAARDSINSQEMSRKFAIAEMNSEYEKKEAILAEKSKRQTQFTIFAFLGAALAIALILLAYSRRTVKRRLTLQKEVAEYEQKALHLQMNPHFVFNCLSSISSFIVQNGTDQALKYLSKFSKLMRLTLEYSKDSLIPIDKEIESLQNYLELEQLRFHNKFKFNIQASDKVEFNMGLPPLLIQPFVENAILHGVVPKEENGKIEIYFDVENHQLVCTITDNGIGLSQSKQLKANSVTAHKSMALEITKKRLEIMESTTSKSAHIDIADREETEREPGTKVTLRLPIQYIQ